MQGISYNREAMRRLYLAAAAALGMLLFSGAASAFDLPGLTAADISATSRAPAAGRPAPQERDWTVMVYLNAKNNLEEAGLKDLNEMESAGSTAKVAIVAELGRVKGYYDGDGDWTGVRRYLVQKDADMSHIASPVLADLGATDMGDYRTAEDFVRWAKENYPARHYLLIVWDHGSGWTRSAAVSRGISYDDGSGNHMTVPQLAAVLKDSGGADIYASDACLMQMAEVAGELRDHAAYIVGSEETEPADGYPYDAILAKLDADPAMTPRELAGTIVNAYGGYYSARGTGATLSALDTAAFPEFLRLTGAFVSAAEAAGDRGVIKRGLYYAQHYSYEDNKDLDSFLAYVAAKSRSQTVKDAAGALQAQLRGRLVAFKAAADYAAVPDGMEQTDYTRAGGLAVYLPGSVPAAGYSGLRWAADSGWGGFLDWTVHK